MSLPGVDYAGAESVLAVLGDVTRVITGRITKQGASHGRWMLIQAAQHVGRHPGPLGVFFRRLARKKNRNVAVVATARKLVTIAWHMLNNNELYRYAQPKTVQAKYSRLRVRVTGQNKKTGGKGQQRPATYGTGQCTRAVPALDQIYRGEGLPPLNAPSAGEQHMLAQHRVAEYALHMRQSHRTPRKSG